MNAYQWRKDGAVLGGETLSVLSFPSLQLPDRGRYTCEVNVTVDSESTSITSDQDHIIAIQSEFNIAPSCVKMYACMLAVELVYAVRVCESYK